MNLIFSQERFLNDLFTKKSKDVFSDVSMMLFVFDVASEQYEVYFLIVCHCRWIGRYINKQWRN